MQITVPYTDIYAFISQGVKKSREGSGEEETKGWLDRMKVKVEDGMVDKMRLRTVDRDTVEVSIGILSVRLTVEEMVENDIVVGYEGMIGKLFEHFGRGLEEWVVPCGGKRMRVRLGSNGKMAGLFEWVAIEEVIFMEDSVVVKGSAVG